MEETCLPLARGLIEAGPRPSLKTGFWLLHLPYAREEISSL